MQQLQEAYGTRHTGLSLCQQFYYQNNKHPKKRTTLNTLNDLFLWSLGSVKQLYKRHAHTHPRTHTHTHQHPHKPTHPPTHPPPPTHTHPPTPPPPTHTHPPTHTIK